MPLDDAWFGQTLSAVRKQLSGLVLGAVHDSRVVVGVSEDPALGPGDSLLVTVKESS